MTEKELSELIALKMETARLDFKERLNWQTSSKEDKCKIVRDVLAFANYPGGGRLILGVRDKDFVAVGLGREEFESFDVTTFNNFLRPYADPVFACSVQKFDINGLLLVVVEVPEFRTGPIICKKDFQSDTNGNILQKGVLYIRKESAESSRVETVDEMRALLNRALKSRSDEILRDISVLLSGRSPNVLDQEFHSDSIKLAAKQIEANLGDFNNDRSYGELILSIRPSEDLTSLNRDVFSLKERYRGAQVAYRGWTFPYLNSGSNGENFPIENGFTTYTKWERYVESSVALLNGVFAWRCALWEDLATDGRFAGKKVISFISLIYSSLEYILFLNRFYDFGELKASIVVSLEIHGTKGRQLVSYDSGVPLWENYVCKVEKIVVPDLKFNIVESISDPKSISSRIVKSIFAYFDFRIEDLVLDSWQEKFLTRRL